MLNNMMNISVILVTLLSDHRFLKGRVVDNILQLIFSVQLNRW